jgi:hypothetical protein
VKVELVLLPAALRFGILGTMAGALLGEIVGQRERAVAFGLILGVLLAVIRTDASRTTGLRSNDSSGNH